MNEDKTFKIIDSIKDSSLLLSNLNVEIEENFNVYIEKDIEKNDIKNRVLNKIKTEETHKFFNSKKLKYIVGLAALFIIAISLFAFRGQLFGIYSTGSMSASSRINMVKAEDNSVYFLDESNYQVYSADTNGKNIHGVIDKNVISFITDKSSIYYTTYSDNNIYKYDIYTGSTSEYLTLQEISSIKKAGDYIIATGRGTEEEKLIDINSKEEKPFEEFLGKEFISYFGVYSDNWISLDYYNNNYYVYARSPLNQEFYIIKIDSTDTKKELLYKGNKDVRGARKQYGNENIYFRLEEQVAINDYVIHDIYKINMNISGKSNEGNILERVTEHESYIFSYNIDSDNNIYILISLNGTDQMLKIDGKTGKEANVEITNLKKGDLEALDSQIIDNYLYLYAAKGEIKILDLETNEIVTRSYN
jgi:hypothetical protein